jgi:hypothetical protein
LITPPRHDAPNCRCVVPLNGEWWADPGMGSPLFHGVAVALAPLAAVHEYGTPQPSRSGATMTKKSYNPRDIHIEFAGRPLSWGFDPGYASNAKQPPTTTEIAKKIRDGKRAPKGAKAIARAQAEAKRVATAYLELVDRHERELRSHANDAERLRDERRRANESTREVTLKALRELAASAPTSDERLRACALVVEIMKLGVVVP